MKLSAESGWGIKDLNKYKTSVPKLSTYRLAAILVCVLHKFCLFTSRIFLSQIIIIEEQTTSFKKGENYENSAGKRIDDTYFGIRIRS